MYRPSIYFKPTSKAPAAESNGTPQRSDDALAQTESNYLEAKAQNAKRKLQDHEEQIKPKRQKAENAEAELEGQKARLNTLQQQIALTTALVGKERNGIAEGKAKTRELEQELASIQFERVLEARKAANKDWERDHLVNPSFQNLSLGRQIKEWIEGRATSTIKQYVKSVLFDELTGAGDAQITALLKRLGQHAGRGALPAIGSSEGASTLNLVDTESRPARPRITVEINAHEQCLQKAKYHTYRSRQRVSRYADPE